MPDGCCVSNLSAEQHSGQPPRSFEEDEDESGWRLRRSQLEALGTSSPIINSRFYKYVYL